MTPRFSRATRAHRAGNFPAVLLPALLLSSMACGEAGTEDAFSGSSSQPLIGTLDVDTPQANSAVRVFTGTSCSGVLVHPQIVMTAYHCRDSNPGEVFGPSWNPTPRTVNIRFGVNMGAPTGAATSTMYSLPPRSKNTDQEPAGPITDMILYWLTNPVPETIAIPRPAALTEPGNIANEAFCVKGYGGNTVRHWANASNYRGFSGEEFIVTTDGTPELGDSGGPTFMYDCDGPVVGETRGISGSNVLTRAPYARRPSTITTDVATWLRRMGVIEWHPIEHNMQIVIKNQSLGTYLTRSPIGNAAPAPDRVNGSTHFVLRRIGDSAFRGQLRIGDEVHVLGGSTVPSGYLTRSGSSIVMQTAPSAASKWRVEVADCVTCVNGMLIESAQYAILLRAENGGLLKGRAEGPTVLSGVGASARWRIERAPTLAFRSGDRVAFRSKISEKFLGRNPPSVFEDSSTTPVPSDVAYHFVLLGPVQYGSSVLLGNAAPGAGWLMRNGSSVTYTSDTSLAQTKWILEPTCSNCTHVFPEETVRLVAENGRRLKDKGAEGLRVYSGGGADSDWIIMDASP